MTASPLWPDRTPAVAPAKPGQGFHARGPVPGVAVPDGDLSRVDGVRLLAADPATDRAVQSGLKDCPDGSSCRLRPPAYADLTGDGRRELVLAYDDLGRTILWVYTAVGEQAHAVLEYAGRPGLTADTLGTGSRGHRTDRRPRPPVDDHPALERHGARPAATRPRPAKAARGGQETVRAGIP